LAAKADVNATRGRSSADRVTAPVAASRNDHLNVVQAILAAKADVNAGSIPALYQATAAGNLDMVRVLVAAKPDLDWRDPMAGTTTLMLALAPHSSVLQNNVTPRGNWDIARLLVEAGANVNVMTRAGVTALMLVAQEDSPRSLAMVQALLAAHADINGGCVCRGTFMLEPASPSYTRADG
jgi:ankyrin repeat protein